MSETDYRTGPMEVWKMARGELLGPVVSKWPDANNEGKFLEYYHRAPNGAEDAEITAANVRVTELGPAMVFILRARDADGNLIYKKSEFNTIRTNFPPDELFRIVHEFAAQCEELADRVSNRDLGNSSTETKT